MEERAYSLIDLGISIGAASLIAIDDDADENSPWLFAIPGVFFASVIYGVVSTERCRHSRRAKVVDGVYIPSGPVLYRSGPSPRVPASKEGLEEQAVPPTPGRPANSLPLPDDLGTTSGDESGDPVTCNLYSKFACPPRHVCIIVEGEAGICKPDKAAPSK